MYGASRVVGTGPLLKLGGEWYRVQARTVRHYAEIEAQILSHRGNAFDYLRHGGEAFIKAAFASVSNRFSIVTFEDYRQWLRTWDGRVFSLWQSIRCNRLSYGRVRKLVEFQGDAWWFGAEDAIEQANVGDEVGSLDWLGKELPDGSDEGIPWELIVRTLGEEPFAFSPEEVFRMTLKRVQIFWGRREELRTKFETDDLAEIAMLQGRAKAARDAAIHNLMNGRRWDSL